PGPGRTAGAGRQEHHGPHLPLRLSPTARLTAPRSPPGGGGRRVGQHGLEIVMAVAEIVMAVAQALDVRQEPAGKSITARISLFA
ncbi:hypothetical protein ABZ759_07555, partial [Streptomyces sp. NPDC047860]